MTIGERIREQRERRHRSQSWLAEQVGIRRAQVSQVENGRRRLQPGELEKFAAALRVNPWTLSGEDPPPPSLHVGEVLAMVREHRRGDRGWGYYESGGPYRPTFEQGQLAEALGTSQAWVSRRESGAVPVSVRDLFRICAILEVSPTDVVAIVEHPPAALSRPSGEYANDEPWNVAPEYERERRFRPIARELVKRAAMADLAAAGFAQRMDLQEAAE